jgi:hypothetical protein
MRRTAALAFALALMGCLREGPSVGGKLCAPDSGECGGGLACVTRSVDGVDFGLPAPGGICEVSPVDCDVHKLTCPSDAGMWICAPREAPGAGCFAEGADVLAGSVCMVGLGACRTYGVFRWDDDGGTCALPAGADPQKHIGAECQDGGGSGALCLCDGVDQDCSGTADDFPAAVQRSALAAHLDVGVGTACHADGGPPVVLEPAASDAGLRLGGVAVDGCAEVALGHAYSVGEVDAYGQTVNAGTCGNAATGTAATLALFATLDDGGVSPLGTQTASGATVTFTLTPGNYRALQICLPSGGTKPFGFSGVAFKRELSAGHCDLP